MAVESAPLAEISTVTAQPAAVNDEPAIVPIAPPAQVAITAEVTDLAASIAPMADSLPRMEPAPPQHLSVGAVEAAPVMAEPIRAQVSPFAEGLLSAEVQSWLPSRPAADREIPSDKPAELAKAADAPSETPEAAASALELSETATPVEEPSMAESSCFCYWSHLDKTARCRKPRGSEISAPAIAFKEEPASAKAVPVTASGPFLFQSRHRPQTYAGIPRIGIGRRIDIASRGHRERRAGLLQNLPPSDEYPRRSGRWRPNASNRPCFEAARADPDLCRDGSSRAIWKAGTRFPDSAKDSTLGSDAATPSIVSVTPEVESPAAETKPPAVRPVDAPGEPLGNHAGSR